MIEERVAYKTTTTSRFEKKYIVQGLEAIDLLSRLTQVQYNNSYLVTSTYYDSMHLDSLRQCRDGNYHKVKYRLRNYNQNRELNYWEVKTKAGSLSTKTRMPLGEIQSSNELENLNVPIYLRGSNKLVKTITIQYRRIVLQDKFNFRVTLDYAMNFQGLFKNYQLRNLCVIEVKSDKLFDPTSLSLPPGPFTLKPAHSKFSKYYHCMKYILEDMNNAF